MKIYQIFKKTLFITSLFFLISNVIYSQTLVNKKLDGFYSESKKTLKIKFDDYNFNGNFESVMYKYSNFLFVEGLNNNHLLIQFLNKNTNRTTKISKLFILEGEINQLKKMMKRNKLDKVKVVYEYNVFTNSSDHFLKSDWSSENYLFEKNKKAKEKEDLVKEYFEISKIDKYSGVYNVEISKSGSISYKGLDYKGELFIDKNGASFYSSIPSIDLIRASHEIKEYTKPDKEGGFYLRINKGYGENMSISINESMKAGAFTISNGRNYTTTIFKISKFSK